MQQCHQWWCWCHVTPMLAPKGHMTLLSDQLDLRNAMVLLKVPPVSHFADVSTGVKVKTPLNNYLDLRNVMEQSMVPSVSHHTGASTIIRGLAPNKVM